MRKRVLWCVTGSGSFMHECVEAVKTLVERGVAVEVCFSRGGEEVAKAYGVIDDFRALGVKLILERSYSGHEVAGRVASGRYRAVVIAPATSNTVAKILLGVADTLPTIAASQALKNRVPLYVAPSDYSDTVVTTFPCVVRVSACTLCATCVAFCPTNAIALKGSSASIDYSKCVGCGICAALCPSNAITCWAKAVYSCYARDVGYSRELEKLGIRVYTNLSDLVSALLEGC